MAIMAAHWLMHAARRLLAVPRTPSDGDRDCRRRADDRAALPGHEGPSGADVPGRQDSRHVHRKTRIGNHYHHGRPASPRGAGPQTPHRPIGVARSPMGPSLRCRRRGDGDQGWWQGSSGSAGVTDSPGAFGSSCIGLAEAFHATRTVPAGRRGTLSTHMRLDYRRKSKCATLVTHFFFPVLCSQGSNHSHDTTEERGAE
jgi:hypothetical protein